MVKIKNFNLDECFEHFEKAYKLNQMNRFSTEYHVHDESVSSHSFYVTLFVMYLSNYYNFDVDKAMKMAMIHDLPESFISDFPFHIKQENPEIQPFFDQLDSKYIDFYDKNFFPGSRALIDEYNNKETLESLVVYLCDMLSSCLFCITEVTLGNNYFAKKAKIKYDECVKRIRDIEIKIEQMED